MDLQWESQRDLFDFGWNQDTYDVLTILVFQFPLDSDFHLEHGTKPKMVFYRNDHKWMALIVNLLLDTLWARAMWQHRRSFGLFSMDIRDRCQRNHADLVAEMAFRLPSQRRDTQQSHSQQHLVPLKNEWINNRSESSRVEPTTVKFINWTNFFE